jgi:phospholipid/cholesterol/gamma-HCH transport system substrate-binding protein
MRRGIRANRAAIAAIAGLLAIAGVVGGYILVHQRLPLPWKDTYRIHAELESAQAVTPGQGQQVAVAGVPVGELTDVRLRDGIAVVEMKIERSKLANVHADATALLRPKTPLQDMQVQLDEVLGLLDDDTRAYLTTTIDALGRGLRGRDLRAVLRSTGPTLTAASEVTQAVNARRRDLRRLVGSLRRLTGELGPQQRQITRLVRSAASTFDAVGDEDTALRAALDELPGTLRATRLALERARPLARRLPAAAQALRPLTRALPPALDALRPALRDAPPDLSDLRRLVRATIPLAGEARPVLEDLRSQTPDLQETFGVLDELTNMLAYNPGGDEEGYLFWLAWFAHNAQSMLSTGDANGPLWHGAIAVSCSTPAVYPRNAPAVLGALLELFRACPEEVR